MALDRARQDGLHRELQGRLRDELLNETLRIARVALADLMEDRNTVRAHTHSAIGNVPPTIYAKQLRIP